MNREELTLRQQVYYIRTVFRVNNYSCKSFKTKDLNTLVSNNKDKSPYEDGINYLRDKGAISVKETDDGQVVTLIDYDRLCELLINLPK